MISNKILRRLKGLGAIAATTALTVLVHEVGWPLVEHAVFGWVDEQIAEIFGIPSPRLDDVIHILIGWGLPFALGAIVVVAVYKFAVYEKSITKTNDGDLEHTREAMANRPPLKFEDHLGHTYSSENNTVTTKAVQITATNTSGQEIELEDAYVLSEHGEKVAMCIKTSEGLLRPSEITAIAPQREVTFVAEFNAPNGIPAREFFNHWRVMYLTAKYDRKPHTLTIG